MGAAPIGVAVVGAGMAGRAHAAAYRSATTVFDDRLPPVRLVAVADVNERFAADAARRYGFARPEGDWRAVAAAADVDAVSVAVANDRHREIVEGLMAAGKHVLCEKPLAGTLADAESMVRCAQDTGRIGAVGYCYRWSPAISGIAEQVRRGALGTPVHFDGRYWLDYSCDPRAPMSWRYRGGPGSGVLADVGSHLVDTAEQLCGPVTAVAGATFATVVTGRPVPLGAVLGHDLTEVGEETEPVDNEDVATFTATFAGGAVGTFSVSRVAPGHAATFAFELAGRRGAASFDLARPTEFGFFDEVPDAATRGFRTVRVGPRHPYLGEGVPMPFPGVGHGNGEFFTYQARAFLHQVAGLDGLPACASFADGLRGMRVLQAVVESAGSKGRTVTVT
jgi:predicted dehydrogenase